LSHKCNKDGRRTKARACTRAGRVLTSSLGLRAFQCTRRREGRSEREGDARPRETGRREEGEEEKERAGTRRKEETERARGRERGSPSPCLPTKKLLLLLHRRSAGRINRGTHLLFTRGAIVACTRAPAISSVARIACASRDATCLLPKCRGQATDPLAPSRSSIVGDRFDLGRRTFPARKRP